MTTKSLLGTVSLALLLGGAAGTAQAQSISLGHLADYSGATSDVGTPFGQGVADTYVWINKNGGINGAKVNVDTVDYGYQVPRAIAQYKKWSGADKVAAILGWGTADTEALTGFLAEDKIPDISASYAAALSDPTGAGGKAKPAPYNFFYGPSYSDAVRGMLTWAADDWKAKGKPGKPKFVHMGANHPYPNAPKAAGAAIAAELGFDVLEPIVFALTPGDYSAQCLTPEEFRRQLRLSRQHRGLEHFGAERLQGRWCRCAVPRQRRGMDENAARRPAPPPMGGVSAAHRGGLGGSAPHEDRDGNLQDVRRGRNRLSAGALHRRRLHRTHEGSVEWAAKNGGATGENVRGLLSKGQLGAGRNGRRLQCLDLDRQGSPRHAQGGSLSHEGSRVRRCAAERSRQERRDQARVKTIDLPRKPEWLG
jgi:branched-chain amino acid transport system substrate-binding protein